MPKSLPSSLFPPPQVLPSSPPRDLGIKTPPTPSSPAILPRMNKNTSVAQAQCCEQGGGDGEGETQAPPPQCCGRGPINSHLASGNQQGKWRTRKIWGVGVLGILARGPKGPPLGPGGWPSPAHPLPQAPPT